MELKPTGRPCDTSTALQRVIIVQLLGLGKVLPRRALGYRSGLRRLIPALLGRGDGYVILLRQRHRQLTRRPRGLVLAVLLLIVAGLCGCGGARGRLLLRLLPLRRQHFGDRLLRLELRRVHLAGGATRQRSRGARRRLLLLRSGTTRALVRAGRRHGVLRRTGLGLRQHDRYLLGRRGGRGLLRCGGGVGDRGVNLRVRLLLLELLRGGHLGNRLAHAPHHPKAHNRLRLDQLRRLFRRGRVGGGFLALGLGRRGFLLLFLLLRLFLLLLNLLLFGRRCGGGGGGGSSADFLRQSAGEICRRQLGHRPRDIGLLSSRPTAA
eukprot:Opistho-1_new@40501